MTQDRHQPGRFGPYGGQYVAETLMPALRALERAYQEAEADPAFAREFDLILRDYVGRPSPLYLARRLSAAYGKAATIWPGLRRGPVKNGISSRTCRRALAPRRCRIRSTIRCSSSASNARIHS